MCEFKSRHPHHLYKFSSKFTSFFNYLFSQAIIFLFNTFALGTTFEDRFKCTSWSSKKISAPKASNISYLSVIWANKNLNPKNEIVLTFYDGSYDIEILAKNSKNNRENSRCFPLFSS